MSSFNSGRGGTSCCKDIVSQQTLDFTLGVDVGLELE